MKIQYKRRFNQEAKADSICSTLRLLGQNVAVTQRQSHGSCEALWIIFLIGEAVGYFVLRIANSIVSRY